MPADLPEAAIEAACQAFGFMREHDESDMRAALLAALPHLEAAIRADEYRRGYIAGAADATDDEGRTHFVSPSDEARIRADERERIAREVESDDAFTAVHQSRLHNVHRGGGTIETSRDALRVIAARLRAGEQTTTTKDADGDS